MDVFDRRIVHAALAASFRVQRRLEYRAKDGRADTAPIEVFAGAGQKQVIDFLIERRDFNVFIGK